LFTDIVFLAGRIMATEKSGDVIRNRDCENKSSIFSVVISRSTNSSRRKAGICEMIVEISLKNEDVQRGGTESKESIESNHE
jgi:hypothetical protein